MINKRHLVSRQRFYDALAPIHHELYLNWRNFCRWQYEKLLPYLALTGSRDVLDASCSIGTQAIELAIEDYRVTAIDISAVALDRARENLAQQGVHERVNFVLADFLNEETLPDHEYDRILLLDNAISHATDTLSRERALRALCVRLRVGGLALFGIRDYDQALISRPTTTAPAFYDTLDGRRIVHQVWDWGEDDVYEFHLHIVRCGPEANSSSHLSAFYRASSAAQLKSAMIEVGFVDVKTVSPAESGYHQHLVIGRA
jgi:glycine/sarcosine N-methyltransferase